MISKELRESIATVVTALFQAPIRSFVPEINYERFIENEDSVPFSVRAWLQSTAGSPQNAIVQLILLSRDPNAHNRGDEPHPFIVSKDMRTDGWQTAGAIALEAGIAKQWPKTIEGVNDIAKRPRLQSALTKISEQTISGTKLAVLVDAIQLCMKGLSMMATTESVVNTLKEVCAIATHLNLAVVSEQALTGVCIGLADMYTEKMELGEARFEIANSLDPLGRYAQKAIQAPLFQTDNPMTKTAITHAKALVHEKMHADIESYRMKIQALRPSTDEKDYINAMMAALRHFDPSVVEIIA
tara:strand:- start:258 stop:1154 length:897 start_codon:yes stop_codon:yes gene_type:complete